MIKLVNVSKSYIVNGEKLDVLKNINLDIKDDDFVIILGKSGSGKTTLLNIIAGYDLDFSGNYYFCNTNVKNYTIDQINYLHQNEIGYLFQESYLLKHLNVSENIYLPMFYKKQKFNKEKIKECLHLVNLDNYDKFYVNQLSGGQKQRVALARCIYMNVKTILLDEPTGSLDKKNATEIMEQLKKLNQDGYCIILVTHDTSLINYATKVINLEEGYVV